MNLNEISKGFIEATRGGVSIRKSIKILEIPMALLTNLELEQLDDYEWFIFTEDFKFVLVYTITNKSFSMHVYLNYFFEPCISFMVGNCVNWSRANPPTENAFAAHRILDWPRSGALSAAKIAITMLMEYTVAKPMMKVVSDMKDKRAKYKFKKW